MIFCATAVLLFLAVQVHSLEDDRQKFSMILQPVWTQHPPTDTPSYFRYFNK